MITNLFGATLEVARNLGIVSDGTATGGSTTTIVDTLGRKETEDYWAGTGDKTGTVWITYDAGGVAAAPQGEWGKVSAFATSTSTITFRPAMTVAVASGDGYAIAKKRYPLFILIQCVNQTLYDLGVIPYTDTGTISMAAGQSEYTLPTAAKLDLREVWLQTNQDSDDNRWARVYDWKIQHSDIGSANKLILPSTIPGYDVKVVYMSTHPTLRVAADKISENVHPDRVIYAAASKALIWYRNKTRSSERSLITSIAEMEQRAAAAAILWPIPEPSRRSRLFIAGQE
jgi:hypothetical protein